VAQPHDLSLEVPLDGPERVVLVTAHRRESFGEQFENICHALRQLAERNPDVRLIYPVHLNPNVQKPVYGILKGVERVHLIDPLPYPDFAHLMNRSTLVLTDSGGLQEEAPSLGKPVLVMRRTTERPEAVKAGTARLVGTDTDRIVGEAERLLHDEQAYAEMANAISPFGDGHAAERIVDILLKDLAS
jgi:UDP-N-acetylglucosamine 2-epimerase